MSNMCDPRRHDALTDSPVHVPRSTKTPPVNKVSGQVQCGGEEKKSITSSFSNFVVSFVFAVLRAFAISHSSLDPPRANLRASDSHSPLSSPVSTGFIPEIISAEWSKSNSTLHWGGWRWWLDCTLLAYCPDLCTFWVSPLDSGWLFFCWRWRLLRAEETNTDRGRQIIINSRPIFKDVDYDDDKMRGRDAVTIGDWIVSAK